MAAYPDVTVVSVLWCWYLATSVNAWLYYKHFCFIRAATQDEVQSEKTSPFFLLADYAAATPPFLKAPCGGFR